MKKLTAVGVGGVLLLSMAVTPSVAAKQPSDGGSKEPVANTAASPCFTSPSGVGDYGGIVGFVIGKLPPHLRGKANIAKYTLKSRFKQGYCEGQRWIRRYFSASYLNGRPTRQVQRYRHGLTRLRFYQPFSGGSFGRSALVQKSAHTFLSFRYWFEKPVLITGTIYEHWLARGDLRGFGGPTGLQYRNGPYIQQGFERGCIGFPDGNPGAIGTAARGQAWCPPRS